MLVDRMTKEEKRRAKKLNMRSVKVKKENDKT